MSKSSGNSGGWFADLFGGQDKTYTDKAGNEVRMSQSSSDRAENQARGGSNEYPHHTHNNGGDDSWHYSWSRTSDRVDNTSTSSTSSDTNNSSDNSSDSSGGSFDLFDPSTW